MPPRKIASSPNSNANPKPNPDLDRGAIFRTPFSSCLRVLELSISAAYIKMCINILQRTEDVYRADVDMLFSLEELVQCLSSNLVILTLYKKNQKFELQLQFVQSLATVLVMLIKVNIIYLNTL